MIRNWTAVILAIVFLSVAGCTDMIQQPVHKAGKEEESVVIVKMQDTLYCFKCHSIAQYNGGNGKFPHAAHQDMLKDMVGILHCNQCHEIQGHQMIRTIRKTESPCSNCHG